MEIQDVRTILEETIGQIPNHNTYAFDSSTFAEPFDSFGEFVFYETENENLLSIIFFLEGGDSISEKKFM